MPDEPFIFTCPYCAKEDFWPEGDRTRLQLWQESHRYLCRDCGALFDEPVCLLETQAVQLATMPQAALFVM